MPKPKRTKQQRIELAVKLLTPHRKGCDSVRSWPDNPWWMPGKHEYRDSIGRKIKHGKRRWIVLECNSTRCDACAIVREDSITGLAQAVLTRDD